MTVADRDLEFIQQGALRAAGDMRSEFHALQGGEAVARRPRLHGVRIEARAGDRACFQRFVQRVLVDQPATARIDEKGAGSHGGEERTVREPRVLWDVGDARRTDAASVQPTAIASAIPFFIVLLHSGRTTYLRRLLAALVQIKHVARHSRAIEPAISNPGSDLGSNSSFFLLSTCPRKITVSMSRVSAMWWAGSPLTISRSARLPTAIVPQVVSFMSSAAFRVAVLMACSDEQLKLAMHSLTEEYAGIGGVRTGRYYDLRVDQLLDVSHGGLQPH